MPALSCHFASCEGETRESGVTPCHMREVFRTNMYKSKQFTSVRFRDFVVLRVDKKSEKSPALNWDRLACYRMCMVVVC